MKKITLKDIQDRKNKLKVKRFKQGIVATLNENINTIVDDYFAGNLENIAEGDTETFKKAQQRCFFPEMFEEEGITIYKIKKTNKIIFMVEENGVDKETILKTLKTIKTDISNGKHDKDILDYIECPKQQEVNAAAADAE